MIPPFRAFDWLPFAALIDNSVLVVHGGIGSGVWVNGSTFFRPDIDWLDAKGALRPIRRTDPLHPSVPAASKARMSHLHNIVWSDPTVQCPGPAEWQPHFMPNTDRGAAVDNPIVKFNAGITKEFCERNHISMVIRSHQVAEYGYQLQHDGLLCTVFSARNYAGTLDNDAAMVLLQPDERGRIHCKFKTLRHLE